MDSFHNIKFPSTISIYTTNWYKIFGIIVLYKDIKSEHQTLTAFIGCCPEESLFTHIWNVMGMFNDVVAVGNSILCAILSEFYCFGFINGWIKCVVVCRLSSMYNYRNLWNG